MTPGPEPKTFERVGKVALLRWNERRTEHRAKDPLDGLSESLTAHGITTRAVEVGPGGADNTTALERLWAAVEGRVRAAPPYELRGTTRPLGNDAAKVVQELGVDAVALYFRLDRWRTLPPVAAVPPPDFPAPSAPAPLGAGSVHESRYKPVAALALVSRQGQLVWYDWGQRDEAVDVPGPVNPAEALEEVVRLLTGQAALDER